MRAFIIDRDSPLKELPSKLVQDAPTPKINPKTQVLVDVHSASCNFFDILKVEGKHQRKKPHPFVLGTEIAGLISKDSTIPEGCDWIPGKTRVFGAADGSYADQVAANVSDLFEVPHGFSYEEASGLCVTWPTSYGALKYRGRLQPGETVLVHAGSGGVGLAALQIAKAMGAITIATAGSEAKLKICQTVGLADHVVNYRDPNWTDVVKKITKGRGIDVCFDGVGLIRKTLKVAAWNSRLIVVGFAGSDGAIEQIPTNLVLLKNCEITGVFWGQYAVHQPELVKETWSTLMKWFSEKKIKPTVYDTIYDGLEQLPEAMEELYGRNTWGKVCLRIKADPEFPLKEKSRL